MYQQRYTLINTTNCNRFSIIYSAIKMQFQPNLAQSIPWWYVQMKGHALPKGEIIGDNCKIVKSVTTSKKLYHIRTARKFYKLSVKSLPFYSVLEDNYFSWLLNLSQVDVTNLMNYLKLLYYEALLLRWAMWPLAAWASCNLHFISAMKKNMNLIQAKFIMFMCNVHGFLILLCKMPCNINSECNACTFVHFFLLGLYLDMCLYYKWSCTGRCLWSNW